MSDYVIAYEIKYFSYFITRSSDLLQQGGHEWAVGAFAIKRLLPVFRSVDHQRAPLRFNCNKPATNRA